MEIEIKPEIVKEIENLILADLNREDFNYLSDWLLCIGLGTIKTALKQHPELSIGDLMMLQFRGKGTP